MSVADKIGLLPVFDLLAGYSFAVTWLLVMTMLLFVPILIAIIAESRTVPLHPRDQFLSFFPGDLFLGTAIAWILWLARELPPESRWYNSSIFHVLTFVVCMGVALGTTRDEYVKGIYPKRAIFSPTKLYHNFMLYGGVGYVAVVTLAALLGGARSWSLVLPVAVAVVWVGLVIVDSTLVQGVSAKKAAHAHDQNWQPIWMTWRVRRARQWPFL